MRECRLTVFFPVYISSVFVAKSCVYICVWTKHCVCVRHVRKGTLTVALWRATRGKREPLTCAELCYVTICVAGSLINLYDLLILVAILD